MSNWKTKNSALDLYHWSPQTNLHTAYYIVSMCSLSTLRDLLFNTSRRPPSDPDTSISSCVLTSNPLQLSSIHVTASFHEPCPSCCRCDCTSEIYACFLTFLTNKKSKVIFLDAVSTMFHFHTMKGDVHRIYKSRAFLAHSNSGHQVQRRKLEKLLYHLL